MSMHNICFHGEIRKCNVDSRYPLISFIIVTIMLQALEVVEVNNGDTKCTGGCGSPCWNG